MICYLVAGANKNDSFYIIANKNVRVMRECGCDVELYTNVSDIELSKCDELVLHPFFYAMIDRPNVRNLVKNYGKRVIAFEVADSDAIGQTAMALLNNYAKAVVVPSLFSQSVYVKSGSIIPVVVWRHFLEEPWWSDIRPKSSNGPLRILYFVLHSSYRKGADLLAKALDLIDVEFKLIVKTRGVVKELERHKDKMEIITEHLTEEQLIQLYDSADVVALPSRGGGFEMNGLEALARGVPVVAPAMGPWVEYFHVSLRPLLAKVARLSHPLPNNPIHVGLGFEVDVDDFADKLIKAPYYRHMVVKARDWLKQNFSIDAAREEFRRHVKPYIFQAC